MAKIPLIAFHCVGKKRLFLSSIVVALSDSVLSHIGSFSSLFLPFTSLNCRSIPMQETKKSPKLDL